VNNLQWIGAGILTIITLGMVIWNRQRIAKEEKVNK
jgi:PTS system galactitol-specific IIC component